MIMSTQYRAGHVYRQCLLTNIPERTKLV